MEKGRHQAGKHWKQEKSCLMVLGQWVFNTLRNLRKCRMCGVRRTKTWNNVAKVGKVGIIGSCKPFKI